MQDTRSFLFDTVAEYETELATARESFRRQMLIGSEHNNNSGGSSRGAREIDTEKLENYITRLRKEMNILKEIESGVSNAGAIFVGACW
jgi:ribosomal protein L19E